MYETTSVQGISSSNGKEMESTRMWDVGFPTTGGVVPFGRGGSYYKEHSTWVSVFRESTVAEFRPVLGFRCEALGFLGAGLSFV